MTKKIDKFMTAEEALKVSEKRYKIQFEVHKQEYKSYIMRQINESVAGGWDWAQFYLPCGMPYYYSLKAELFQWLNGLGYILKVETEMDHNRPILQQVESFAVSWQK